MNGFASAGSTAREWLDRVLGTGDRRYTVMEVCGGQTHALLAHGLDALLAPRVELLHGPGCPVCVTPAHVLDRARALARIPGVALCTFGDMLRVPGRDGDLFGARARGGDVRVVYSPLDALALAEAAPGREVVFLGVGFETTAPTVAAAVRLAARRRIRNFSVLTSHVRVPPALEAILGDEHTRVEGLLAAGHVCTVMGVSEYRPLVERFRVPIVVTGFEPLDLLEGTARAVAQLASGRAELEIQYRRAVRPEGNPAARQVLEEVFEVADVPWRGIGVLPGGGWVLRRSYRDFDAWARLAGGAALPSDPAEAEGEGCQAGRVLRGVLRPDRCPHFGRRCTPATPLGAPMVSAEGACAAYFRYRPAAGAGDRP